MPQDQPQGDSAQVDAPQTETQNPQAATEISSLRNFRERQASSAAQQPNGQGGESGPNTGEQDNRSQSIPRQRFDEVNTRMQQAEAAAQQYQQQVALMQMQMQQYGSMQQAPQQGPQQYSAGGMVQPQQQPQQQQVAAPPDFNNPEVEKQWRERIAKNPIHGLRELFQVMLQTEGAPLLEQQLAPLREQLSPLHQTYMQTATQQYEAQRAQDPTFQQVRPFFQQAVQEASRRNPGMVLNQQQLGLIEYVARQQATQYGVQIGQQPQQQQYAGPNVPFTENPGAAHGIPPNPAPAITPQIRAMAQRFRMDPAVYVQQMKGFNNGR